MATDVAAQLYLGLISGTSADGIDAALLATEPAPHVRAARTVPYPDHLRRQLLELAQDPEARLSPDLFGHIDAAVGEAFATAALELLQAAGVAADEVRAIGSHGQTLRHRPDAELPFSLQVGDPARIAERTGITTVADFRRRDMAAGGQGAPLMPAFHAAVFGDPACDVAVLNLGGIANLTLLPARGPVRGFDTGPANALMDAWMLQQHGAAFDRDGAFAASGRVHAPLLESLLDDAYFARPAPKSTGREVFHPRWLQARMQPGVDAADVQATLLELTVHTVVAALEREMPSCSRVLACGGGAGNAALMHRLAQRLGGRDLHSTAARGIDPDHVEAAGFAWLAWRTLHGLPGNLPSVTGAAGARVLGAIHPA